MGWPRVERLMSYISTDPYAGAGTFTPYDPGGFTGNLNQGPLASSGGLGGNRGSGQPINQPYTTSPQYGPPGSQGGPLPAGVPSLPNYAAPNGGSWGYVPDGNGGYMVASSGGPVAIAPTFSGGFVPAGGGQTVTGSLAGLGTPQANYQPTSSYDAIAPGGGAGSNAAAQNAQNQDKLSQVVIQVANSGLTGQQAIDAINQQMGYDTGIVWDPTRGNFDVSTGGPNGVQYDTNAQGVYGAHPFNDAGMPGGGGGGLTGFGSLINTLPTEQQAMAMPGIQFGVDEANRALQAGAAAKGTLLNGRTQQAIGQDLVGYALNQGYLPLAQLGLGYNQANFGNLYNLSQLGLSGVQTGNQ